MTLFHPEQRCPCQYSTIFSRNASRGLVALSIVLSHHSFCFGSARYGSLLPFDGFFVDTPSARMSSTASDTEVCALRKALICSTLPPNATRLKRCAAFS